MNTLLLTLALAALSPGPSADPYPGTYQSIASAPVLIRHATVLTGDGRKLEDHDVLLQDGRIAALGQALTAPADASVVDGQGRWLTPGIIDVHSHLGVYPSPETSSHQDGNETSAPVTAQVWVEHGIWPQDPGFATALAGGVTSLQVLPGSANLIGGRGVTLKNVAATSYQAMRFPGAKRALKMACGENPKRYYGEKGVAPISRMGNVAGYRAAFFEAQAYQQAWKKYRSDIDKKTGKPSGDEPGRNLQHETLVAAMQGELLVHIHCYRADEMAIMLDLAKEFGFKIAAFHHGVEAYKLADRLASEGVCGALWADWWGFKMEALDAIQENIALVDRPTGGCAIVHSDSPEGIQRLNQEAAKVMVRAGRVGLDIPPERAITWLTRNPAKALGIVDQTGTLEPGKMADVVLWSGNPFSVYAHAEQVYIDGARLYDRQDPARQPRSDFLLGQALSEQEVTQ